MTAADDFDQHDVYRAAAALVDFVYGLEDRFPDDERELFQRLRTAAVDVGARIAEGFGRDGLHADGSLSEPTRRETLASLSELRHYVLTAHRRFLLDERRLSDFEERYRGIRGAVTHPEG